MDKNEGLIFFDFDGVISKSSGVFGKRGIIPRMDEVIAEARNFGELYVISSMGKKSLTDFFRTNDLEKYISGIYGYEDFNRKKDVCLKILSEKNISPAKSLFVTDTARDASEADACFIKVVAVLWGYGKKSDFLDKNIFYFAERPEDLVSAFHQFFTE